MIVDSIKRLPLYADILPYAAELYQCSVSRSTGTLPFPVRDKQYSTKADTARKFEVHRKTIDVMLCFDGAEIIHICPEKNLTPDMPLGNGEDGMKLIGKPQGTALLLCAGYFVAIFPGEAHMVGGQRISGIAEPVSKWVAKLPAPEAFCR